MPHAAGEGSGHPQHGRYAPRHYTPRQIRRYVRRARPAPKVFHHGHYRPRHRRSVGQGIALGARQGRVVARRRRIKQLRRQAARDRRQFQNRINSFHFLQQLVGGKPSMQDAPLANTLWSHQKRNLFGTAKQVDTANVLSQFGDLWNRAHKLYPKSKAGRPSTFLSHSDTGTQGGRTALAYALGRAGKEPHTVVVTPTGRMQMGEAIRPDAARTLNKQERNLLRAVPLHEWAHLYQHGHFNQARDEGGAEAFAQSVAPRFGYRYRRTKRDPYQRFANRARRRGRRYVRHGQFR